jgi:hypothetical protein
MASEKSQEFTSQHFTLTFNLFRSKTVMKYKITYIAAISISVSLSGTSENQTFDDNR